MKTNLDKVLDELAGTQTSIARPGAVASQEGTTLAAKDRNPQYNHDFGKPMPPNVDALFGQRQAYITIKKEKFEHRLVLWYKLQGYSNREVAQILGYQETWLSHVTKQPWFQDAFNKLAAEMGKDAIQTFLEGEVLPALYRTVDLANNASENSVKLAANREILDRFLGKSTVKVESKGTVDVNHTVLDANRLIEEQRRLDEQLRANGLVQHGNS